jgi:hypothetical protein
MLKIKMEERGDGLWRIVSVPFEIRNQPISVNLSEITRARAVFRKGKANTPSCLFITM